MSAPWFIDRVRSGQPLSGEHWDRLLREYHLSDLGRTPGAWGVAVDPHGRTSYQRLAAAVDAALVPGRPAVVIDLACGDGAALAAVTARHAEAARVIGLDRSPVELRHARVVGPATGGDARPVRALLVAADANRLPLPAGCADAVVCHMAFGLFPEPGRVAGELARVVRAGGVVAAVVQRPPVPIRSTADEAGARTRQSWRAALAAFWREEFGAPPPAPPVAPDRGGRPIPWPTFAASPLFADVSADDFTVVLRATPLDLWHRLYSSLYLVWALDAGRTARLRGRVLDALARHTDGAGTAPHEIELCLVRARRAGG
jgi:SAM-dependent methyltransferase